jgi:serine/threonine-protein kinase
MPAARVIHVLAQACGALAEAHAQRLVHRDVKPENILLGERGGEWDVVKVMDFGLVRDTSASSVEDSEAGMLVGTPETIAPECAAGEAATAASDLYGLAAVGWYLLTGRRLFEEPTLLATLNAHVHKEPRPPSSIAPSVPHDLERVLLRSLAKRPGDRHPSAGALRDDLVACDAARAWSRDEAAAWWDRHGAAVRPAAPATTRTLRMQTETVVDLRNARVTP